MSNQVLPTISLKSDCKGIFWRGIIDCYAASNGDIVVRKSLCVLEKMSCPGCEKCNWLFEYFREDVADGTDYLNNIEHGRVYTFTVRSSQGYFDTYPEIDDIEFVAVEEES